MAQFRIYDERLNQVPAQIDFGSWDEMISWSHENGLSVSKRRFAMPDSPRDDLRKSYQVENPIVSFAYCTQMGSPRVHLIEF